MTYLSIVDLARSFRVALVAPLLVIAVSTVADAARLVDCGATVTGNAELRDSCVGDIVVRDGKLDLAGHTLFGTVRCQGELCEVVSDPPNGTIRGRGVPGSIGIVSGAGAVESAGAVAVDSIIISGFATGISAAVAQVERSLIAGNLGNGVDAAGLIEARDSIVSLNGGNGLHSRLRGVSLTDCQVTENLGSGVRALEGVIARRSQISDNRSDGIENYSARATVVESQITGNGRHGVRSDDSDCEPADVLELVGSSSTANGTSTDCGEATACADLVSCAAPVLRSGSSCGTSYRMMSGLPGLGWNVCSLD